MIVIYAEKPDQGRKIGAALGIDQKNSGYMTGKWNGEEAVVVWGFGHMCSLKQAKDYDPEFKQWTKIPIPFIPEVYEIMPRKAQGEDKPDPGVLKQLQLIKGFLTKKGVSVISSTDYDREGSVIFSYVAQQVGFNGPFKRVKIDSMTDEGIRKSFSALLDGTEETNRTLAGRARSIADWVVGINLTTATTLKFMRGKGQLSIGRVQTATLNMLVERELEIRNFISKPFYSVQAEFETAAKENYLAQHGTDRFETRMEAEAVLDKVNGHQGTVATVQSKEKTYSPPVLYSQTTLQMAANSHYGLTLQQTLDAAQTLYEKGYATYPRTSSQYLTSDMKGDAEETVKKLGKMPDYAMYVTPLSSVALRVYVFDDKKVESHYAIIPTGKAPSGLSDHEAKVYDLIAKSLIRLAHLDAIIRNTAILHDVAGEPFVAKGSELVQLGWFCVDAMPKLENLLPCVTVGEVLNGSYSIKEGKTEPPKRFNDKTLVSAMAAAGKTIADTELREILTDPAHSGIGTEATRAGIVETLERRNYISRKGKQFFAEEEGVSLIQIFPIEDLKSPVLTAQWEKRLGNIERGKEDYSSFVNDIEEATMAWSRIIMSAVSDKTIGSESGKGQSGETVGICPMCGKDLVFSKPGVSCTGFQESGCAFVIWRTVSGKTLTDAHLKMLAKTGKTKTIKGFKSKKTGKPFEAELQINAEHKLSFVFADKKDGDRTTKETDLRCPICNGKLSFSGIGLTCENHKETGCPFVLWRTVCSKDLTDAQLMQLVVTGATKEIAGFKSKKTGKPFTAALLLDKDHKAIFGFREKKGKGETRDAELSCPVCGGMLQFNNVGLTCKSGKDCKFTLWRIQAGKELDDETLLDLAREGRTDMLDGFVGKKTGKSFSAVLYLDPEGKVLFDFGILRR